MSRQDAKEPKQHQTEPTIEVDRLAHVVIGAAIEVHRCLGPGLQEKTYEEALSLELSLRKISFARQVPLQVTYKNRVVGNARADLVVDQRLLVELKAVETVAPIHLAQLLSYLRIAKLHLGLLLNFNVPEMRQGIKRIINTSAVVT